ncbi:MAG TPA: hypothetical protein PKY81_10660 [bacterium]|nr:hypothetical protein [bacterium]
MKIGDKVEHHVLGKGAISDIFSENKISVKFNDKEEAQTLDPRCLVIIENQTENQKMIQIQKENPAVDYKQIKKIISDVIDEKLNISEVNLGNRWHGGTLILKPKESDLKPKEIPIETFFHKIIMIRDRLRVLEQNINSNDKLCDEEKINLQQYITRCYGSLTTFNILFAERDDWFIGEKS